MEKSNRLTEGKIGNTLLKFAIPFLIANLLQALYGAADLFVVGQFSDSAAVSSVAIGSQVMQTITGVVTGISMGGTVLIGQRVGEGKERKIAKAVGTLAVIFFGVAVLATPVMVLGTETITGWMNTPKEAVGDTVKYLFVCGCGIPFIIGYNGVSAVFRGLGDSKTPVYFIAIACVINIIVDFVMVAGFGMGAKGAAIATVAAQGVSFILALTYLCKRGFSFPFTKKDLRPDRESAVRILKVGFPLAVQDFMVNLSFLLITVIINGMGLIASAAVGVVEKIIGFAMLPPAAFASAVATMTAQNIGAGKEKRALKALQYGIGYSLIFGVLVCIYSQILPDTLTSIFSSDKEVIAAASGYLRSYAYDCILVSFVFNMNAYFSGCGKSLISLIHSLIATFGVRIPVSYFLSRIAGITMFEIGLATPAASLLSIVICACYFQWQRRTKS